MAAKKKTPRAKSAPKKTTTTSTAAPKKKRRRSSGGARTITTSTKVVRVSRRRNPSLHPGVQAAIVGAAAVAAEYLAEKLPEHLEGVAPRYVRMGLAIAYGGGAIVAAKRAPMISGALAAGAGTQIASILTDPEGPLSVSPASDPAAAALAGVVPARLGGVVVPQLGGVVPQLGATAWDRTEIVDPFPYG